MQVVYFGQPKYNQSINDWPCAREAVWSLCAVCNIPNSLTNSPIVKMRGNCKRSAFDSKFRIENDDRGYVRFIGKRDTIISYDADNNVWEMILVNDKKVRAITKASMSSLALGKHAWIIDNDSSCHSEKTEKVLSFSICSKMEFTCPNGLCIPGNRRCNGRKDCFDGNDEKDCKILKPDSSYNKFLSPEPLEGENKLVVKLSIDILTIQNIDEIASEFRVQYILKLAWSDSRLVMINLKEGIDSNSLDSEEKSNIWIPKLIFANTDEQLSTVLDDDTSVKVQRMGSYSLADMEALNSDQIYDGKENELKTERFYNTIFDCQYDMAWYPFDTQKCSLIFQIEKQARSFVKLIEEELTYSGSQDLQLYFIKHKSIGACVYRKVDSTCVDLVLGRRLLSVCLTTILPTVLLLAISHLTNYFKDFFFEAVVTVNLTVMLVNTTMFASITNKLPLTSYVKMIEVWMIFTLFIPFCEVFLHTYMDMLREDEERDVNHHGKSVRVGKIEVIPLDPNLVSRNEQVEVKARRTYYANMKIRRMKRLKFVRKIAVVFIPIFEMIFISVYWYLGIKQYLKLDT